MTPLSSFTLLFIFFFSTLLCFPHSFHAQQPYIDNKQLNCDVSPPATLGYSCNGLRASCTSYLTFRSQDGYQTPRQIANLLSADPSAISKVNRMAIDSAAPLGRVLIVPAACACSGRHYQHGASYTLTVHGETYFLVANNTYEGLSTCQALMASNPYDSRGLKVGTKLKVPLRCACPTAAQSRSGVRALLSYLVTWGDGVTKIASRFGVDQRAVLDANQLSSAQYIYPSTTLLVPLKVEP